MILFSCRKYKEYNQQPELGSLQQGLKTSVAVGYCASIAMSAFREKALPSNVTIISKHSDEFNSSWNLYIKTDKTHPLPFNSNIGDIVVTGLGDEDGGVISILFGDLNLLGGTIKLYGLYLVPVQLDIIDTTKITAVFFKEDFVFDKTQSNTILDFNLTTLQFNSKMANIAKESSSDPYVAVRQNFWVINIYQNGSYANIYDDDYYIAGGGQVAEVEGSSGGIIYHAIMDTRVNYSVCTKNPIHGFAFSQNLKANGNVSVDLGNSILSFHSNCDGMVHVDLSTGKYLGYNGKSISLGIQ